jgi:hypothetical protein
MPKWDEMPCAEKSVAAQDVKAFVEGGRGGDELREGESEEN